jgi:hypothetical protein
MLRVTTNDLEKLHKTLRELDSRGPHAGKALPIAAKESLNTSAFAARREWEKQGKRQMHVRNKWTFKGKFHQVVKARARKNINQMEAVTGNKHRYMAEQEAGVRRVRAKGLQIPEERSRIGGDIKRIVSRSYWRRKIGKNIGTRYDASHGKFGGNRRRYAAGTIRAARAQGKRYIYLEYSRRQKGIYDLNMLKKGMDLKNALIWDMSRWTTYTKPHPMLRTTLKVLEPHFKQFARMALEEQIRFVLKKRGIPYQGPPAGLIGAAARASPR